MRHRNRMAATLLERAKRRLDWDVDVELAGLELEHNELIEFPVEVARSQWRLTPSQRVVVRQPNGGMLSRRHPPLEATEADLLDATCEILEATRRLAELGRIQYAECRSTTTKG